MVDIVQSGRPCPVDGLLLVAEFLFMRRDVPAAACLQRRNKFFSKRAVPQMRGATDRGHGDGHSNARHMMHEPLVLAQWAHEPKTMRAISTNEIALATRRVSGQRFALKAQSGDKGLK